MVTERKIKFGIIGCGRISHVYRKVCKNLREEVEINATTDVNGEKLVKFVNNIQQEISITIIRVFLKKIDAVIICLPYYLHKQVTIDALKSGKYVLVEKPMALNYVQA